MTNSLPARSPGGQPASAVQLTADEAFALWSALIAAALAAPGPNGPRNPAANAAVATVRDAMRQRVQDPAGGEPRFAPAIDFFTESGLREIAAEQSVDSPGSLAVRIEMNLAAAYVRVLDGVLQGNAEAVQLAKTECALLMETRTPQPHSVAADIREQIKSYSFPGPSESTPSESPPREPAPTRPVGPARLSAERTSTLAPRGPGS